MLCFPAIYIDILYNPAILHHHSKLTLSNQAPSFHISKPSVSVLLDLCRPTHTEQSVGWVNLQQNSGIFLSAYFVFHLLPTTMVFDSSHSRKCNSPLCLSHCIAVRKDGQLLAVVMQQMKHIKELEEKK